ncbi:hypothetical protein [Clostridium paraputrificum]|uniref:hypothetical protein n=1 Tax=Clostridium paraputrificum TaxID=29363 RepID=UPI00374FBD14
MKKNELKNNLWYGICYLLAGIFFVVMTCLNEDKLSSLFSGFAGAGIVVGIIMISRYFYWSNPKRVDKLSKKIENEEIILHDERNTLYRDKAGRYAYIIGMIIIPISIIVFSILNALEIYNSLLIILYLSALWIVLYVVGIVYYRKLKNNG